MFGAHTFVSAVFSTEATGNLAEKSISYSGGAYGKIDKDETCSGASGCLHTNG